MSEPTTNGGRAARRRSRPERVALRRLAVALVLLAGVIVVAGGAGADAPIKQGWWAKWQTEGSQVPPPPTGDGGLTVAMGSDGPQAVAAMLFQGTPDTDATVYLRAAVKERPESPTDTTVSTTVPSTVPSTSPPSTVNGTPVPSETSDDRTGFALPPGATVMACTATKAWEFEMNGPYAKAPTWAADTCTPGTVTGGNLLMFWSLSSSMQGADGSYDIVLVPTYSLSTDTPNQPVPGDQVTAPSTVTSPEEPPYTVNFDPPDSDTFVTDPPEEEPPPEPPIDGPEPPIDDPEPEDSPFEGLGPVDVPGPDGTDLALPPDPDGSTLAATRLPRGRTRVPIDLADTRMERIMAATMLLIMALALWWLGGSPARLPRMIGAAVGRKVGVPSMEPSLRGVGRFARERGGRPPRL